MLLSFVLVFSYGVGDVSAAPGDAIYVNGSSGNDLWDGLSATWTSGTNGPKRSIKNATGTVNSNGTIYIADGNYRGLNNTKITLSKNMNIIGQSQTGTIINGTDTNWIFKIQSGITVTIQNLTLANGNLIGNGGAIYNNGNLTVNNSIFTDNNVDDIDYLEVPVNGFGGAIYNTGTLIVDNSNFISNSAIYGGAAIHNTGDLTVTGSNFVDNHVIQGGYGGGAIGNKGDLTITDSNFTKNDAYCHGGAICNEGDLTVTGSDFRENAAYGVGGAIFNYKTGTLTVTDSNFIKNYGVGFGDGPYVKIAGGAIYNDYGGIFTVSSSQFSGNIPQDIYNSTKSLSDIWNEWEWNNPDYGSSDPNTTVKAASKTIPLQKTGLPLAGPLMAVLIVLGGFAGAKRK